MNRLHLWIKNLRQDVGAILSSELVFVAVVALIGLVVTFTAMREAAVGEFSDLAGAVQDSNQMYAYNGLVGNSSTTHGSAFTDDTDAGDTPEDESGTIDNGIVFSDPTNEGEDSGGESFSMIYEGEGPEATATVGAATPDGWLLWSNGEIVINADLPEDGDYRFCSRLWASQGGPDLANAELSVDGVAIDNFDVTATTHAGAETFCVDVNLSAGSHQFSVAFTNDFFVPPIDRNLFVDWLHVEGPN